MSRTSGTVLGVKYGPYAPNSLFTHDITAWAAAGDQGDAKRAGNQFCYGRKSESGLFYGYGGWGYGGHSEAFNDFINFESFTDPLWVVPAGQPLVKVWIVKTGGTEEELATGAFWENIQTKFNAVPMPLLSAIPKEHAAAAGTDRTCEVWQPAYDRAWEMHRLSQFASGPLKGQWKCSGGYFASQVSTWNGVCVAEEGQQSASGLSALAGDILLSDLVKVFRGGHIDHALKLVLQVVTGPANGAFVAPAKTNDTQENKSAFLPAPEAEVANPAFGTIDAVHEGTRLRFPASSHPSEFGITKRLSVEIFEAVRKYGLIVTDKGGNPSIRICDPRTLFSPYCDVTVNPLASTSQFNTYTHEGSTEAEREGWVDPTLEAFGTTLNGAEGALVGMPWRTLEAVEARAE